MEIAQAIIPNHQSPRQLKCFTNGDAEKNKTAWEMVIQLVQIVIGKPRSSGLNHMVITIGPKTEIIPTPIPSIKRLNIKTTTLLEVTPISEPIIAMINEVNPAFFTPIRLIIDDAGKAIKTPINEKIELSHPAVCALILKFAIKIVIIGEILFCTNAKEIPPTTVDKQTSQRFLFFAKNRFPLAKIDLRSTAFQWLYSLFCELWNCEMELILPKLI